MAKPRLVFWNILFIALCAHFMARAANAVVAHEVADAWESVAPARVARDMKTSTSLWPIAHTNLLGARRDMTRVADSQTCGPDDRFVPAYRNGRNYGFKVFSTGRCSFFEGFDVRPGDVITAIDDIPVSDPDKFLEAWARVKTAKTMRLTVLRKGKSAILRGPVPAAWRG